MPRTAAPATSGSAAGPPALGPWWESPAPTAVRMPVHAKPGRANLGRTIAMVVGVLVLVGAMAAGILAITGDDEARTPAPAETESQTDALPASLKLPGIP